MRRDEDTAIPDRWFIPESADDFYKHELSLDNEDDDSWPETIFPEDEELLSMWPPERRKGYRENPEVPDGYDEYYFDWPKW